MSTPRFEDVLNQIVAATVAALNAAGIATQAQVGIGTSTSTELVKILNNSQYQITLLQREGTTRSTARYPANTYFTIANPTATLVATVGKPSAFGQPWTITFSGSVGAGAAVFARVGATATIATYACGPSDSLATVATNVAAAIGAIPGVSASATGAVVSVNASPMCAVTIAGTGAVVAQEVNRLTRSVQMTINCPNPDLRFQVVDAIESAVGTVQSPFVALSDGTQALVLNTGGATTGPSDDAQSSYSLYLEHLLFEVEYGVLRTYPAYPIAVVDATLTTPSGVTLTALSGG